MICPKCNHNQKYKEGTTCFRCKYKFIFNPKVDDTNDLKFSKIIDRVSVNDSVHFTFNQFYAEFIKANRLKASSYVLKSLWLLTIAFVGFIFFESIIITLGVVIVGFLINCMVIWMTYKPPRYAHVEQLFIRWNKKEKPSKFIAKTSLYKPPKTPVDKDIYDYGVEAILFLDEEIYVDLFVLNNIHTDLRALVMSKTGYPDYLSPICKHILKNNPDIPVFVLQNAYNDGKMIENVKKTYQIQDREIMNLGLFIEDFDKIKRLKKFRGVPSLPLDVFTKNELVNLLSISMRDGVTLVTSAATVYPHDDPAYGSFG